MNALVIAFWVWSVIVLLDEATNVLAPTRRGEARTAALYVAGFGIVHMVASLILYTITFFIGMVYAGY